MSKVELYEKIRLARRDDALSIRALAAQFGVHRREVRAALASPEPASRKTPGSGGAGDGRVAWLDPRGPGRGS